MVNPSRFLGRKAGLCSVCKNDSFFVNSIGGIQCIACNPPKTSDECLMLLRNEDGFWQDGSKPRFDCIDCPGGIPPEQYQKKLAAQVTATAVVEKRIADVLTAREINLFWSDEVWDSGSQTVVINGRKVASEDQDSKPVKPVRPPIVIQPLPQIGLTVQLPRRIQTFGRSLERGAEFSVTSAGNDGFGAALVDLSKDGRVVACGVAWPIL